MFCTLYLFVAMITGGLITTAYLMYLDWPFTNLKKREVPALLLVASVLIFTPAWIFVVWLLLTESDK